MIAFVIRIGCGFLALVLLVSVVSCSLLAQLYVPAGEPVLGGIAPDAQLVVTAQVAPVYADPRDDAQVVGSFVIGTAVRATGPDTAEWVRVSSVVPAVSGWVRRTTISVGTRAPPVPPAGYVYPDAPMPMAPRWRCWFSRARCYAQTMAP